MNTVRKRIIQMFAVCFAILFLYGIPVKADSADNSLQSLTLSEGTLSPAFQYNVVAYTASVGSGTTRVDVKAKVSDPLAAIQSITGNEDLKEGSNTIKVTVKAENGNLATYTITVTRAAGGNSLTGGENQPADNEGTGAENQPADNEGTGAENQPADSQDTGADSQQPDSEDVAVNTGSYTVSATIPEEIIPADFTMTEVTYQEQACDALQFDKGEMLLLYMTDEAGSGALFVWNQSDGSVYPFIRLTSGDNYIMIQPMPAADVPEEGFLAAELTIHDQKLPSAYRSDTEELSDFYLIYAMNSEGESGTYWYDQAGGTYQRYVAVSQEEDTSDNAEYKFLQKEFKELSDKYTNIKSKDTKIITGMIIALAICIIVIINLFLSSGKKAYADDELEDKKTAKKPKKSKEKVRAEDSEFFDENIWKPKKEKPKKKKKRREDIFDDLDSDFDDEGFYDDDEDFEDRDEKSSFQDGKSSKDTKPSFDDLEILDLNDL